MDPRGPGITEFLTRSLARIVVVAGPDVGEEFLLDAERLTVGRDPGADICIEDPALAGYHAVIEFVQESFRIRTTAGEAVMLLNGRAVTAGALRHGRGRRGTGLVATPVRYQRLCLLPTTSSASPAASATPPTTGVSGIVFFVFFVASMGPMSMTFSRVV
jgi:pSer/pThr/pTyr-binding forkhead associated (FHA) protein